MQSKNSLNQLKSNKSEKKGALCNIDHLISIKPLIQGQINLIKFIKSNKFDIVLQQNLTHFCLIKSV